MHTSSHESAEIEKRAGLQYYVSGSMEIKDLMRVRDSVWATPYSDDLKKRLAVTDTAVGVPRPDASTKGLILRVVVQHEHAHYSSVSFLSSRHHDAFDCQD